MVSVWILKKVTVWYFFLYLQKYVPMMPSFGYLQDSLFCSYQTGNWGVYIHRD